MRPVGPACHATRAPPRRMPRGTPSMPCGPRSPRPSSARTPPSPGCSSALLAGGHVLLEGVPGVAKTLLVRTPGRRARPRDQAGAVHPRPDARRRHRLAGLRRRARRSSRFREGPVFTNLLLADEINRTPPKTQAALLEAMEERQVTRRRRPRPLPEPFIVVATQNPVEYEGTYPLPEAQLDRFLLKLVLPVPDRATTRSRCCGGTPTGFDPRDLAAAGVTRRWLAPADLDAGAGGGDARSRCRAEVPATSSTSPGPPASRRRCRLGVSPARRDGAARRPAGPGPGSSGATSSRPTTSRRSRTPRCATASRCAPRPSSRASTSARCSSSTAPRRRCRCRADGRHRSVPAARSCWAWSRCCCRPAASTVWLWLFLVLLFGLLDCAPGHLAGVALPRTTPARPGADRRGHRDRARRDRHRADPGRAARCLAAVGRRHRQPAPRSRSPAVSGPGCPLPCARRVAATECGPA